MEIRCGKNTKSKKRSVCVFYFVYTSSCIAYRRYKLIDLIKEKRRLRQLYNTTQDPDTKSTINKLHVTDTDDDSAMVADVDPDTLIRTVRSELKNGKAPGIDNVYNDILKTAIGVGFYTLLAQAFTISLKLSFIPMYGR